MLSHVRSSSASCETAVLRAQRSAWLCLRSPLSSRCCKAARSCLRPGVREHCSVQLSCTAARSRAADWQCEYMCSCGCVAADSPDAHNVRALVSGCMSAPIAHTPAAGPDLSATGHRSCRAQSRRHTRTRCSQLHDRAHGRLMRHTPPIRTGYPRYLAAARSGHRRAVSLPGTPSPARAWSPNRPRNAKMLDRASTHAAT